MLFQSTIFKYFLDMYVHYTT